MLNFVNKEKGKLACKFIVNFTKYNAINSYFTDELLNVFG